MPRIWNAVRFTTDKIAHGYLPTYLRIAAEAGPAARVCEVGVDRGHSLEMWQALFPSGTVAGVDMAAGACWPEETHRVVARQDDPGLPGLLSAVSPQWDLIVEDASHDGNLSRATFALLWPLVAPGGWYVLEDWMVAFWGGWDRSMLAAVESFLPLLASPDSDVESVTCSYGLAVVRKRARLGA